MQRIQRKRTKDWKMPANTIYVGRPSKWGNPFPPDSNTSLEVSLRAYRGYLEVCLKVEPNFLEELKGKDLACWCPLDQPCHADILLERLGEQKQALLSVLKDGVSEPAVSVISQLPCPEGQTLDTKGQGKA